MTTNQLAYWENQEKIRANKESEAIKRQQNALTAEQNKVKQFEAEEKARTNRANEALRKKELVLAHEEHLQKSIKDGSDMWNKAASNAVDFISLFTGGKATKL